MLTTDGVRKFVLLVYLRLQSSPRWAYPPPPGTAAGMTRLARTAPADSATHPCCYTPCPIACEQAASWIAWWPGIASEAWFDCIWQPCWESCFQNKTNVVSNAWSMVGRVIGRKPLYRTFEQQWGPGLLCAVIHRQPRWPVGKGHEVRTTILITESTTRNPNSMNRQRGDMITANRKKYNQQVVNNLVCTTKNS